MSSWCLIFCITGVSVAPAKGLDAMKPVTVEDFTAFGAALKNKIVEFQVSLKAKF